MKLWRVLLGVVTAAVLANLLALSALWQWGGTDGSLASGLQLLASQLPAGQQLQVQDVQGSLRNGGSIGHLSWQQGGLRVQASKLRVGWLLGPLLQGELRFDSLALGELRIDDQRPPQASTPPSALALPFKLTTPLRIDTLIWQGGSTVSANHVSATYHFDGQQHLLSLQHMELAAGVYQGQASLQARAPLALTAQLQGRVQTQLPSSGQPMTVQAQAELQGALAGPDATLVLNAKLTPELKTASGATTSALQAQLSARLQPWQTQSIQTASANWQQLDLAALWPQAPQTLMTGQAQVTPDGANWRAKLQLSNSRSGPWNQQRLPLEDLKAALIYANGLWVIESLQAQAGGGSVKAQGKVDAPTKTSRATALWQGQAELRGVNLAALDSRLPAGSVSGELTAQQTASGLLFKASLQPLAASTPAPSASATGPNIVKRLQLKLLTTQGQWQAGTLSLNTLTLQTEDAQLSGQLSIDTQSLAAQGHLALRLPGAQASLNGQMASTQGKGDFALQAADMALASRWLARWPSLAPLLGANTVQGEANLTGSWLGGWQQQGQTLQVQASLRAPRLVLGQSQAPQKAVWLLHDWQADLSGSLAALSLSLRGQLDAATTQISVQAQAHGARVSDGVWQAQLDTAQLMASNTGQAGSWRLQLDQGTALKWQNNSKERRLDLAAGTLRVSGPLPGSANIQWQSAYWLQAASGSPAQWRTQGNLQGLPLAWLDWLGQTRMANMGLRGDMLLGGQWEATSSDTLQLRATLARSSGDLQLQTLDSNNNRFSAGVREASVLLTSDGKQLKASLRWDSERAGHAQADFNTVMQQQDGGWVWPAEAALAGTLRAQLPSSGAWSVLAPPGWRLRGTLDVDAVLSGTRAAPQWRGQLNADDMALTSVVDGIDFSQGRLRARLDGQGLVIDEFSLHGAGGNAGGQATVSGSVLWPAASAAPLASRLRMTLKTELKALRLSTRAERRLSLSGQLDSQLQDAVLTVRGKLQADEAMFILPDDTTPQLGDDVLVRSSGSQAHTGQPVAASTDTPALLHITPDVNVTLDLGRNFQLRGRGLVSRLAGSLELRSGAERGQAPRLTGELRAVMGTYQAYGQQLDIEQGVLRFNGPYDNPALNILALRPNLQQRVGVQISGTALAPVVRLYSEPDLPDAEKLAWLVLGHSAANGGAESAMLQQAALALLGSKGKGLSGGVAQALGLDELSVRGGASSNADGSSTTGATVTLGKRVSRNFYVAYERSLAGTLGTFYIFYDLSRRITLRAQTGEQSAVDLIFTLRYD